MDEYLPGAQSIPRHRRFALVTASVLLLYSVAGIGFTDASTIQPFGITMKITRPEVFEFGLMVICVYAALNYWYQAYVIGISPGKIRQMIRTGQTLFMFPYKWFESLDPDHEKIIRRYFPGKTPYDIRPHRHGQYGGFKLGSLPISTKLWIGLDNLEYSAPIWTNVLALIVYTLCHFAS